MSRQNIAIFCRETRLICRETRLFCRDRFLKINDLASFLFSLYLAMRREVKRERERANQKAP